MPGVARVVARMDIVGPFLGFVNTLRPDHAQTVNVWAGPHNVQIATGTTLQPIIAIGIQGITVATAFLVTADQNITVAYQIPTAPAMLLNKGGIHCFSDTSITAVYISNVSGLLANLTYFIGGN